MILNFNISHLDAIISQDFEDEFFKKYMVKPDVSHISPLDRRRLSICSKSIFHLLRNDSYKIPMVFSSTYAEINRCFNLLGEIGARELLSPTSFSLSVHNANLALNSIFKQNHEEISAICHELSLESGILNAYLRLKDGYEKAGIFVYHESIDNKFLKLSPLNYTIFMVIELGNEFNLEKKSSQLLYEEDKIDPAFLALNSFKHISSHSKIWKTIYNGSVWEWKHESI